MGIYSFVQRFFFVSFFSAAAFGVQINVTCVLFLFLFFFSQPSLFWYSQINLCGRYVQFWSVKFIYKSKLYWCPSLSFIWKAEMSAYKLYIICVVMSFLCLFAHKSLDGEFFCRSCLEKLVSCTEKITGHKTIYSSPSVCVPSFPVC